MTAISLRVTSAFVVSGEIAKIGDRVEVTEAEARSLLHRGKAVLVTGSDLPAQEAAPVVQPPAPAIPCLLGSSILPSVLNIGGQDVQLGAVVGAAQEASGLTVEEWNALDQEDREDLLDDQVNVMQALAERAQHDAEQSAVEAAESAEVQPANNVAVEPTKTGKKVK